MTIECIAYQAKLNSITADHLEISGIDWPSASGNRKIPYQLQSQ
jgi:hypothetical protein